MIAGYILPRSKVPPGAGTGVQLNADTLDPYYRKLNYLAGEGVVLPCGQSDHAIALVVTEGDPEHGNA